jgi:hypothetical protein
VSAAELEAPRPLAEPGDTDTVTFAWADARAEIYGLARLARGTAADGSLEGSSLAVVFAGREPMYALVRGGGAVAPEAGWDDLALEGLAAAIETPLELWTLRGDGATSFALTFEAAGPPAELDPAAPAAVAGGMAGYEQLCRVEGSARIGGRERPVRGLGQRSRAWGNPDWDRIALTRSLGIWAPGGDGLTLTAVRPAGARSHAEEATWAALLGPAGAQEIAEPRLSTTSYADGRLVRAGLELWVAADEGLPRRAAGEALTGSTLDLGALRLDCAFFRWYLDGREGVGRYDVLRHAGGLTTGSPERT